jgi:hypothetical protein
LAYALFILVNATLFIRPGEIVPDLEGMPIYNVIILACLAVSFPVVLAQLSLRSLVNSPISMCVVGLQAAVILSHLSHLQFFYARQMGFDFFKIVLYYLLLIGLLDTPARFLQFLTWLLGFITVSTLLAVLQYHGVIALPSMTEIERRDISAVTGELVDFVQLQGSGIFSDPNDLCLALVMGMGLALYKLTDRRSGLVRILWIAPLGLFLYGLSLTHSRGGLVGTLAGMLALFVSRFGWKRSIPLAVVSLPAMLVLFAGRQTNITVSNGTGQARVQLWVYSFQAFLRFPFFGLGQGLLADEIGQESHNSFIHCYPDMGFFGGTLFLGMFYLALRTLRDLGRHQDLIVDPELRRVRPYLVTIVVGYASVMLSLSRSYIVPTYLVPGLVAVYQRLAVTTSPVPYQRFDTQQVRRLVVSSVAFLILVKFYIHFGARWG